MQKQINENNNIIIVPILPLRNSVFFPNSIIPLTVGREKTIKLIEKVSEKENIFGIVTQKSFEIDDPKIEDIYKIGTLARIIKFTKTEKDIINVMIEGIEKFKILEIIQEDPYFIAKIETLEKENFKDSETEALIINIKLLIDKIIESVQEVPILAKQLIESTESAEEVINIITSNIDASIEEKQEILEKKEIKIKLNKILELLNKQLEIIKLSNKINNQVKSEMGKTQREYYLRQQLKAIKEELGEKEDDNSIEELEEKLEESNFPEEVKKVIKKELKRMKFMQASQAEYTVSKTYIDWLFDMPWNKISKDNLNLSDAINKLNKNHYGLKEIKKRIIEYIAVRKLKSNTKGSILCFVGPPGVGKTSLGKSIAEALGRNFHRISLGGVKDEAEIRGHRRTYIGSLPGRIIQGIKKSGTKNPVILLDEIEKLGNDYRGDPASALLEVLDPEQNSNFSDHYLELSFDLSKTIFIATANQTDTISPALKDRMEIIDIRGYTIEEKINIAKKYLIIKQIEENGINQENLIIKNNILSKIISDYTKESGVRNLEREIAKICRYIAVKINKKSKKIKLKLSKNIITKILGPKKFYLENIEKTNIPGICIGMAWTPLGGEILFIETIKMLGTGNIILTGYLGEIIKESAKIAINWIKSKNTTCQKIKNLESDIFKNTDIHVHIPSGAVQKDGPSAGITIACALISLLTSKNCRSDIAMTGEISLRGLVLPVGGIKEKIIAAYRAGIKTIIIPLKNKKDIIEIPVKIKKNLHIIFANNIEEAVEYILK